MKIESFSEEPDEQFEDLGIGLDDNKPIDLKILDHQELAAWEDDVSYIIDNILVGGQIGVIGGPDKCLKTSLMVAMAISIASGKPFLGKYKVLIPGNVGIFSCERGKSGLKDVQNRIMQAEGLDGLFDGRKIYWSTSVPDLQDPHWYRTLRQFIVKSSIKVLMLDPLYLMLPELGDSAGNVFVWGGIGRDLIDLADSTNCTILLVHHFVKLGYENQTKPPNRNWLTQAGMREMARQWFLLNQKKVYDPNKPGSHQLWLEMGGSEGHSERLIWKVEEGSRETGRKWEYELQSIEEAKNSNDGDKQSKLIEKIVIALGEQPDGMTVNAILKIVKGGKGTLENALSVAEKQGLVKQVSLLVNGRPFKGWALA